LKRKLPIKKVSADLDVLRFPSAGEPPIGATCLNCFFDLSLSQPDLNSPERLLGVCKRCGHWFLIEVIEEHAEVLLWRLPDMGTIRELTLDNPTDATS
jgi:hypothetical protein